MNRYHRAIFPAVLLASFLFISSELILSVPSDVNASTGNSISSLSQDIPHTVYGVQVAACLKESCAREMAENLGKKGYYPDIYKFEDKEGRLWNIILLGVYDQISEAQRIAKLYEEKEKATSIVKSLGPLIPISKTMAEKVEENKPGPDKKENYSVQVAACIKKESARNVVKRLESRGYSPAIYLLENFKGRTWFLVLLGIYDSATEAKVRADEFREKESSEALVRAFDPEVLKRLMTDIPLKVVPPVSVPDEEVILPVEELSEVSAPEIPDDAVESEKTEVAELEIAEEFEDEETVAEEDIEEEGMGEAEEESEFDEAEMEEEEVELSYSGYIEFENYFNTYSDQDFGDANKKNEIRNRLEVKYGTEDAYIFTVSDIYFFPTFIDDDIGKDYHYSEESEISRNLRISNRNSELRFDELYINYSEGNLRLRVGNQIYGWGTADVYNPTSYFNALDVRELIFRDDDERWGGVPSVSSMLFLDAFTLETVFVPVHTPSVMSPKGNFWSIDYLDTSYPIIFGKTHGLDVEPENFGFGARLSASIKGVDISLSGYRGPDKEPVFLPTRTVLIPDEPISLLLEPQYYTISMIGADASTILFDDFVVQIEAAYSPDKRGFIEQDIKDYQNIDLPFEVEKSEYYSYAVGFNYFVPLNKLLGEHEGESVFTFDWFQSKFRKSEIYPPFFTDILTCRFEDSYYNGQVKFKVNAMFETKHGGVIFWPELTYDFLNGLSVYLSYAGISGERGSSWTDNSILYYFTDNDIIIWRIRYEY
ncbi:MAG: SPOR domain-containing protein [Thermodesulfobacteriota bacterium]|nr:SPOR domain-containing protein [Thermodesulfobacteriota bacterium]